MLKFQKMKKGKYCLKDYSNKRMPLDSLNR